MHLTRHLAAGGVGLRAALPSPSQDAQSDPDRTVAGGGRSRARWRAQPDRGRALDVQGHRVDHYLDAHIGALGVHRQ